MNRAIIIGRLGKDPEIKYTTEGQPICNFSIATSERWKSKSGEKVEKTEWHNCTAFGKLAEICEKYLTKGSQIYVEGKIQTNSYEAKDGSGKRYSTKINVREMKMLGGKPSGDQGQREAYAAQDNRPLPDDESDIPF